MPPASGRFRRTTQRCFRRPASPSTRIPRGPSAKPGGARRAGLRRPRRRSETSSAHLIESLGAYGSSTSDSRSTRPSSGTRRIPRRNSSARQSPTVAALYLNWADTSRGAIRASPHTTSSCSLTPPRPTPRAASPPDSSSATGGRRPTYAAYRMPIFLPVTRSREERELRSGDAFGRPASSCATRRRPSAS